MLGLDFTIPNKWGKYLSLILSNIEIENAIWKISEDEILKSSDEYLFDKEIYTDKEFKRLINSGQYYVISANIQLYVDYKNKEIKNYSDYEKSNCLLLLYIVDNSYVQVYSKNISLLKEINSTLLDNDIKNIKEITHNNELKKLFPTYNN